MRLKEISIGKEFKIGLPGYSNLTIYCYGTFEIAEGEEVNWDEAWDMINQQLAIQSDGIDPSWILDKEDYKKFFKITIRVPKKEVKNGRGNQLRLQTTNSGR